MKWNDFWCATPRFLKANRLCTKALGAGDVEEATMQVYEMSKYTLVSGLQVGMAIVLIVAVVVSLVTR